MSLLPVRLEDLVHARTVESVRIDFKATWSEPIRDAVIRTIAAFANDLQGLNGGYIVLGIEEQGGAAILPPRGLAETNLEAIQKEIQGNCNRIRPPIAPPLLVPETLDGKSVLVIYVPASDARPHEAPEHCGKGGASYHYYVRVGPETKEAPTGGPLLKQLMELSPRVPFDQRRRTDVPLSAVSPRLLAEFLRQVGSDLAASADTMDVRDTLRRLRLSGGTNGGESPRNAALLFFTEDPEEYFPGCRVELAEFHDDAGGDLLETRTFRGPLPRQLQQVMDYLGSLQGEVLNKDSRELRASRFLAYPTKALREAVVNALYHRSYEDGHPTRLALYPDRLEITSYPGPVAGLEKSSFGRGARLPPVPPRNPRVGELLKAARLAETWHTGLPKIYLSMEENGSPAPTFDFDDQRTYFCVTLPAHPGYVTLHAQRQSATFWLQGDRPAAVRHLRGALQRAPGTGPLAAQLIEYLASTGELLEARQVFTRFEQSSHRQDPHLVYLAMAKAYLDNHQAEDATDVLHNVPTPPRPAQLADLAILLKRSGDLERAHRMFKSVGEPLQHDARALHEFAQVKLLLAKKKRKSRPKPHEKAARTALLREATDSLERVIALAAGQKTRLAWAWFDLARTRALLGLPTASIEEARQRAVELLPGEDKFHAWRPDAP
jgi:ATP-dependent DNA helicase RecG